MEPAKIPRVCAVVLAGGGSSRMGRAKQLLTFGSRTMLGQTLETVRASMAEEIVLVLGAAAESIRSRLHDGLLSEVKVVVNQDYEQGIATSVRVGLEAVSAGADAALMVLADQPFVQPATLDRIIAEYRRSGGKIIVPVYQGARGNPVLLDRAMFPQALALSGDSGFRQLFAAHLEQMVRLEVEDKGVLLDIDTAADYESMKGNLPPI